MFVQERATRAPSEEKAAYSANEYHGRGYARPGQTPAKMVTGSRTRVSGVSVTCRLYNLTDSSVAAVSTTVTSTTSTSVSFLVAITAGKSYRLELLSSQANQGVFGIGTLENG